MPFKMHQRMEQKVITFLPLYIPFGISWSVVCYLWAYQFGSGFWCDNNININQSCLCSVPNFFKWLKSELYVCFLIKVLFTKSKSWNWLITFMNNQISLYQTICDFECFKSLSAIFIFQKSRVDFEFNERLSKTPGSFRESCF